MPCSLPHLMNVEQAVRARGEPSVSACEHLSSLATVVCMAVYH